MVDIDIATYVEFTLSASNPALQASDKQLIRNAVPAGPTGLFLYAKIAMDTFLQPGADYQPGPHTAPHDLNALYDNLLKEHAQRFNVQQKPSV